MGVEWHGLSVVGFAGCRIACLCVLFVSFIFRASIGMVAIIIIIMSWLLIGVGSVLAERLVRAGAVHQQWHVQQFSFQGCVM